jgi:hypothetical protein
MSRAITEIGRVARETVNGRGDHDIAGARAFMSLASWVSTPSRPPAQIPKRVAGRFRWPRPSAVWSSHLGRIGLDLIPTFPSREVSPIPARPRCGPGAGLGERVCAAPIMRAAAADWSAATEQTMSSCAP